MRLTLALIYHHLHFKNITAEPVLREKMYIVQSGETSLRKEILHTDELDPEEEVFLSWEANYQIWHDQG